MRALSSYNYPAIARNTIARMYWRGRQAFRWSRIAAFHVAQAVLLAIVFFWLILEVAVIRLLPQDERWRADW